MYRVLYLNRVELLLKVYFNTEGKWGHKFFSMRLLGTLFILLYFPFIHSLNKCILSTLYLQSAALGWLYNSEQDKLPTLRRLHFSRGRLSVNDKLIQFHTVIRTMKKIREWCNRVIGGKKFRCRNRMTSQKSALWKLSFELRS